MQNELPPPNGETQVVIESDKFLVIDGTKELLRTSDEKYARIVSDACNALRRLETHLSICGFLLHKSNTNEYKNQ